MYDSLLTSSFDLVHVIWNGLSESTSLFFVYFKMFLTLYIRCYNYTYTLSKTPWIVGEIPHTRRIYKAIKNVILQRNPLLRSPQPKIQEGENKTITITHFNFITWFSLFLEFSYQKENSNNFQVYYTHCLSWWPRKEHTTDVARFDLIPKLKLFEIRKESKVIVITETVMVRRWFAFDSFGSLGFWIPVLLHSRDMEIVYQCFGKGLRQ